MDPYDLDNRFAYHSPGEVSVIAHEGIRGLCRTLAEHLNTVLPEGREKSLAITNLEQVMFWGNAAIARNGGPAELPPVDDSGPTITLRLIAEGESTVTVDRAEYEAAKSGAEADHFLDVYASDIDTRVEVVEPDGTSYDLATGGGALPAEASA